MTSPKDTEDITHLEIAPHLPGDAFHSEKSERVVALEEETPPHLHSKTLLIIVVRVFTYIFAKDSTYFQIGTGSHPVRSTHAVGRCRSRE